MISDNTRGLLCIWTDVDPQHESEFNRWYDTEHMQERVAIPGFQNARRFRAAPGSPQPYLALYYTDNLAVFTSLAYASAFSRQTDWSKLNFLRMRDTQRRVGLLTVEAGAGEGAALAMFVVPAAKLAERDWRSRLEKALRALLGQEHVICVSLLETDAALSTPVTQNASPAMADALAMVEASRLGAAALHARVLSDALGLGPDNVFLFQALWRLGS